MHPSFHLPYYAQNKKHFQHPLSYSSELSQALHMPRAPFAITASSPSLLFGSINRSPGSLLVSKAAPRRPPSLPPHHFKHSHHPPPSIMGSPGPQPYPTGKEQRSTPHTTHSASRGTTAGTSQRGHTHRPGENAQPEEGLRAAVPEAPGGEALSQRALGSIVSGEAPGPAPGRRQLGSTAPDHPQGGRLPLRHRAELR